LFDADAFEAAMIRSCESPLCIYEENMTTKDDGIITALENEIVCSLKPFVWSMTLKPTAHAMDDEHNVPGATANPETIITVPTNKDN
jgi:hypothetical protein